MRIPEGYELFLAKHPENLPSDFETFRARVHANQRIPLVECIARFLEDKVIKLKHTLYGTKQAGRRWNIKLNQSLVERIGFTQSSLDPCLYFR